MEKHIAMSNVIPKYIHSEAWVNDDNPDKKEFALDGFRRIYEAHVGPEFSFLASNGRQYRPAQDKFLHDYGTVPSVVQIIPAFHKDRWRIGYPWHDNLCETGKIKELSSDGSTWFLIDAPRPWSDRFLCFELGVAEGAWLASRVCVYGGVSAGTGWSILRRTLDRGTHKRIRP
jgi:hypothetical protein